LTNAFLPEAAKEPMERQLRADDDPEARMARYVSELASIAGNQSCAEE
jgi:hypothetical protein